MIRHVTNWFRRRKLESGLDRELRYHLDRRISDLEQFGVPAAVARRQALMELGGVAQVQEEVRDVWLSRWLRDLTYDFRFSARDLFSRRRRSPSLPCSRWCSASERRRPSTCWWTAFACPAGSRAGTSRVLIDWKGDQVASAHGSWNLMSYPICRDGQKEGLLRRCIFGRALTDVNLRTGSDSRPEMVEIVSGNYFEVLGVAPALGQVIEQDDDRALNSNPVAVFIRFLADAVRRRA